MIRLSAATGSSRGRGCRHHPDKYFRIGAPVGPVPRTGNCRHLGKLSARIHRLRLLFLFRFRHARNCRLPFWFTQLNWPNLVSPASTASTDPASEELVEIDMLMKPRPNAAAGRDRELFCCFVASHGERHRLFAVEYLKAVGAVDVYGKVSGKPLLESKYSVLPKYRFNLCFENSLFPGYYTEKALQAWVAGCLPLYYADQWFREDFNARAVANRADFRSLAEFAAYVGAIDKTPMHFDAIINEPFLTRRPSLDQAVDFMARTARRIVDAAPRRIFPGATSNLMR